MFFYNKRVVLRKLIVFILFFNFFVSFSVAACDIKKLEEKLLSLNLDSEIRTNDQLFLGIEERYGKEMIEALSIEHSYMKSKPEDLIDIETINWIVSYIWSHKAPNTRYLLLFGNLKNETVRHAYLIAGLTKIYDKSKRTIFVFFKTED